MSGPISSRRALLLGAGLAALTAAVYLVGADRGLEYDGSVTVGNFVAVDGLLTPLRRQITFNNHPVFSFFEHIVYHFGGDTERALVALPALSGAATVGLVSTLVARTYGLLSGVVAGVVLASNPTFAELSRQVRGYSLMCALVVLATILVVYVAWDRRAAHWSAVYVAAMGLAIGTHLYAVLALAAHAALIVVRRQLRLDWVARWVGSLALGASAYIWIADSMLASARGRPKVFHPEFWFESAKLALGTEVLAMAATTVLVVPVLLRHARRVGSYVVAAAVVAPLLFVWLYQRPYDLYPRFLVPLVAVVAAAAAVGVSLLPRLVGVALAALAVGAMVYGDVQHWTDDATPFKAAAGIAQRSTAAGLVTCVGFYYPEALNGYGLFLRGASDPAHLRECEILMIVEGGPAELTPAARAEYPHYRRLRGYGADISVYSRPGAEWLHAPPGTIPPR